MKNIKLAVATTITRAYPNFNKPLTIDKDASDYGIKNIISKK